MADYKSEYKPYGTDTTPKVVINERPKLRPFIVSDKAEEAIDKVSRDRATRKELERQAVAPEPVVKDKPGGRTQAEEDRATRLEVKRQAVAPKPVSSVPKVTPEGPVVSDQTQAEIETGRRMLSRNRS